MVLRDRWMAFDIASVTVLFIILFRGIRDQKAKDSVMVDFNPLQGSKIGELAARFDIVMGFTPEA